MLVISIVSIQFLTGVFGAWKNDKIFGLFLKVKANF